MIIDTQDYNVHLDINDDINVIFKFVGDADTVLLKQAISEIQITDDRSVILLWAAAGRFYNEPECVKILNEFYTRIKNPVVLFSGALNVKSSDLLFIHQPISLFQYISKIEQEIERPVVFNKSKKFLYTSTKDYTSRCYILQYLINNNLASQGTISYRCLHTNRQFEGHLNIPELDQACATIDHLLPYGRLEGETDNSINYQTKPENIINETYLSIITETFYDGPIFLSEKIFYSMLYNHFFVYYGPVGTLQYLRTQGFKTFPHIIDESYDTVTDPVKRLYAVVAALGAFLKKSDVELDLLYRENAETLNHNRKLVMQFEIKNLINSALYNAIQLRNSV